tara:strand:+ start:27 stop:1733 length:1707 start_codon:yes stop_codon:yes gene_type:complete
MATINGTIHQSFSPVSFTPSAKKLSFDSDTRSNYLVSANVPKRYQVRWEGAGVNESYTPTKTAGNSGNTRGDIVNMVFYVYGTTQFVDEEYPASFNNWDLVATIKKSRDIANKKYNNDNSILTHQRFTVDISQVCQDILSYSLVPIGKGTWQSSLWGGMNGGQTKEDNVTEAVSEYNVTPNGSYRHIKVVARPEVILNNGLISEATNEIIFPPIAVINSVHQFESDVVLLYNRFLIGQLSGGFLSYCPNNNSSSSNRPTLVKAVRTDETAEWLYFYIRLARIGSSTMIERVNLKVETSDGNTFYVDDFSSNLDYDAGNSQYYEQQNKMCVQNVSIDYLKNNAKDVDGDPYSGATITDSTDTYTISLFFDKVGGSEQLMSEYRWYKVDREDQKLPYDFVRFHWLNRMGSIDSYTAKRNVAESIAINRDTIETKSADRTWYQSSKDGTGSALADSDYISNTMRGGNLYKGGREVLNVNANRNNSVYTEPLNKNTAEWLQEIMTSPNVWIEMDTDATARGNAVNPYQRPSTKEYIPVIITNSNAETVNQEAGLVSFNIEYTLAHKVQTQRN